MAKDSAADVLARTFTSARFQHANKAYEYYAFGEGKPLIVLHEIYGLTHAVVTFAENIARDAHVRVYLPQFFGNPATAGTAVGRATAMVEMCMRREFALFAAHCSSPAVDAVRTLAEIALTETGAGRFGVIGMCLTGNFALAMTCDARLAAAVVCEPSLPLSLTASGKSQIGIDRSAEWCLKRRCESGELKVLGFRFKHDCISPPQRFESLRAMLGAGFSGCDLNEPPKYPRAHSVFTEEYDDTSGAETRKAYEALLRYIGANI